MNPASLCVKFPIIEWPGWHVPELNLTASSPHESTPKITVRVDPNSQSDYSSDSPVFRACLEGAETPVFALKFAMREDLVCGIEDEFTIYESLPTLQGKAIPQCFGMYTGTNEDGQPIACLLLEFWGECLRQPFPVLPLAIKILILQRLGDIHRSGLLHGDFAERNVLVNSKGSDMTDIRIIDFDQTEAHACKCDMNFRPGEKLPDIEEFGCEQLWEVCRSDLRIWDTSDV